LSKQECTDIREVRNTRRERKRERRWKREGGRERRWKREKMEERRRKREDEREKEENGIYVCLGMHTWNLI